jgi:hypothetical protein
MNILVESRGDPDERLLDKETSAEVVTEIECRARSQTDDRKT